MNLLKLVKKMFVYSGLRWGCSKQNTYIKKKKRESDEHVIHVDVSK